MKGDDEKLLHAEITHQIIGAAFEVHGILGYGFLEKVYQRAMCVELTRRQLCVDAEAMLHVIYKETDVGLYKADLLVNRSVIVELKAAKMYNPEDEAQLLNELKASAIQVGLLINFGRAKVEFKRMVF
jgi:GxxExxY protein